MFTIQFKFLQGSEYTYNIILHSEAKQQIRITRNQVERCNQINFARIFNKLDGVFVTKQINFVFT